MMLVFASLPSVIGAVAVLPALMLLRLVNVLKERGAGFVRKTRFRARSCSKRPGVRRCPFSEKPIPKRRQGGNNLSRSNIGTGNQNT
jgi:hypothetical protein